MNKDYTILVVDDSANIRYMIAKLLKGEGYNVDSAENGQKALEKCKSTPFDLFIIDIVMPEMGGLDLLRRLNVFENTYEAIMVAGDETLESVKKAMELGSFGYIGKLGIKDELLVMAAKALGMVDMKRRRFASFAAMEKRVADRTAELESMVRLLEYQGRQLDSIINSMGEGIVAIDNDQAIVLMNRPAELLLGLSFAECAGSRFPKAVKDLGFAERLLSIVETGAASSETQNILPILRHDGREKYYHIKIQRISDQQGVQTGSVVLFMDLTESVNAVRMRDSFFSIAAHELRTPISIIANYLALLLRAGDDCGEQGEIFLGMQTATRRLSELVNRVISLANFSNRLYTTRPTATDIDKLIQSKIRKLRPQSDENNITVFVDNRLPDPIVSVDPYVLRIAVYNLLSNAVKFNRIGGSVHIIVEQKSGCPDDFLSVSFIDEGDGISDMARNNLFASFSQGEDPLTRTQGGMGIGLYLVKKASEIMGGTIEVFSEKGKGATFTLKIPLL
jgi:PAS domain S-box-containing protein